MKTLVTKPQADHPADCILIHTDGACSGNPGPGGYAAILRRFEDGQETKKVTIKGGDDQTTNIRMEMLAAITALKKLGPDEPLPIIIRTDSELVVKGMTEWLPGWMGRGWLGSDNNL